MPAYTNPSNIFNAVPHAVLQWVLSPFLVAEERGNLNAVLEPTERISRKLEDPQWKYLKTTSGHHKFK